MGVIASAVMPVFFQITASELITQAAGSMPDGNSDSASDKGAPSSGDDAGPQKNGTGKPTAGNVPSPEQEWNATVSTFRSRLVLFGMCLLAAVFARRFITAVADKVLQQAEKASEVASEAKKLAESAKESAISAKQEAKAIIDATTAPDDESRDIESMASGQGNEMKIKVLKALANPKFNFRTRTGIARGAGVEWGVVEATVDDLKKQGLVIELPNSKGQPVFGPTARAKSQFGSIFGQ
jgi:hypothetical protein